jgi:SNF2 family DNA or RNA helicase
VKKGFGTDYRVLVAVISGVGTGTDGLQEKCHVEVWLSQDQDGVQNEQARGRLYRSGQTQPVQRFYIRTAGTIDEDVYAKQLKRGERMSNLYGDTETPGQSAR